MAKIASKGTALKLSISAVFTTIAQVESLTGPGMKPATFDATGLDSGVGMEFKPTGYVDGGEVTGTLFMDPVLATFQALTDLVTTPAVALWKMVWSDGASTEWPFSGVLNNLEPTANKSDGLKANFGVKLDGIPTLPT